MIRAGFGHDRSGNGWMLRTILKGGYFLEFGGYDMTREECISCLKENDGFDADNNPRKDWVYTELYALPERKAQPGGILTPWVFDKAEYISPTGLQDWH